MYVYVRLILKNGAYLGGYRCKWQVFCTETETIVIT